MTEISPELQAEMLALVKVMATSRNDECPWCKDARKLAAELPPPVDPDIEEARKLVAEQYDPRYGGTAISATLQGRDDASAAVQNALKAIKRGRSLERGQ